MPPQTENKLMIKDYILKLHLDSYEHKRRKISAWNCTFQLKLIKNILKEHIYQRNSGKWGKNIQETYINRAARFKSFNKQTHKINK